MKYSTYIGECSQVLAQNGEVKTDSLLPYFIRLQRISEEINDTFGYDDHHHLPQLDARGIELLVKAFGQQLDQLRLEMPPNVWSNGKSVLMDILSPY